MEEDYIYKKISVKDLSVRGGREGGVGGMITLLPFLLDSNTNLIST